ncbi:MAG: hypothetical protein ACRDCZ_07910 [Culicoidibacterales bacterium]
MNLNPTTLASATVDKAVVCACSNVIVAFGYVVDSVVVSVSVSVSVIEPSTALIVTSVNVVPF